VSPSSFIVVWEDLEGPKSLLLWCLPDERDSVRELLGAGLRVWVTGMLLMTGRTSLLAFERASVWAVGALLQPPPTTIARTLWRSERRKVLLDWGECLLQRHCEGGGAQRNPLHPVACQSIRSYARASILGSQDPSYLADILLAADREASVRTCPRIWPQEAAERMGESEFAYDPHQDAVWPLHREHGKGGENEENEESEKPEGSKPSGYLLCGSSAAALLGIAAVIASADKELCWQRGIAGCEAQPANTLVVAPRHALHLTLKIFRAACPWARGCNDASVHDAGRSKKGCGESEGAEGTVPLSTDAVRADEDGGAKLTVVSCETLRREWERLEGTHYSRCVFVDWPTSARIHPSASCTRRGLRCDLAVGLALASSVERLLSCSTIEEDLGSLLGLKKTGLSTRSLESILALQVLPSCPVPKRKELLRYVLAEGPGLTTRELSLLKVASKARSRTMRSLFGEVMPAGGPGARTSSIRESKDVEEFFRLRTQDYESSNFKRAAFLAPAPECPVCFDVNPDCVASCGHYLCFECCQRVKASAAASCPLCKTSIRQGGVVRVETLRPKTEMDGGGFVDFLSSILREKKKKLVISSYGEIHEALAAALRLRGVRALAWAGNSKRACAAVDAFENLSVDTLIVDPLRADLNWVRFTQVESAIVVLPLESGKLEACCAVRQLLSATQRTLCFSVTFVRRQGSSAAIPQEPSCGCEGGFSSRCAPCPFLVSAEERP
jgi:hypothetical protein